jgi:predicted component of type VI protein secretion system
MQAALLAGTAALAVALGAIAAHAGETDVLLAAQEHAAALDAATGGDDLVSTIIKDDDSSNEVVDTLTNLIEEVAD